jgi:uncharacterized protein
VTVGLAGINHAGLTRLDREISGYGRLVVAFSGGADSALLAYIATQTLGRDQVLCATAISPSLGEDARADCEALASEWNLRWVGVATNEVDDPAYIANDLDRCYHCKTELMSVLGGLAEQERATVALGVNLDDLGDWRPGQRAARERGAVFPFVDANLTKQEVRDISRILELRTWDKPANACLSSRVPHGTPVTIAVLSQVDRAEAALRRVGLSQLRVRHYGDTARIECPDDDMATVLSHRATIVAKLHEVGYRYVTIDLEGFRSGNLSRSALEVRDS